MTASAQIGAFNVRCRAWPVRRLQGAECAIMTDPCSAGANRDSCIFAVRLWMLPALEPAEERHRLGLQEPRSVRQNVRPMWRPPRSLPSNQPRRRSHRCSALVCVLGSRSLPGSTRRPGAVGERVRPLLWRCPGCRQWSRALGTSVNDVSSRFHCAGAFFVSWKRARSQAPVSDTQGIFRSLGPSCCQSDSQSVPLGSWHRWRRRRAEINSAVTSNRAPTATTDGRAVRVRTLD